MGKDPKNILNGAWIAIQWEGKTNENEWVLYEKFKNYLWYFTNIQKIKSEFHGKLLRKFGDYKLYSDNFTYDPDNLQLCIDDRADVCDKNCYRIELQSDNKLILYTLHSDDDEFQTPVSRITLKKFPPSGI